MRKHKALMSNLDLLASRLNWLGWQIALSFVLLIAYLMLTRP